MLSRRLLHFVTLLACLHALLAAGCAGTGDTTPADPALGRATAAVIRGQNASTDQIFSAVALVSSIDGSFKCSGTLIASTVVLTAARCLDTVDESTRTITDTMGASQLKVVVGALDVTQATPDQTYGVTDLTISMSFLKGPAPDPTEGLGGDFDLAVLILDHAVPSPNLVPFLAYDPNNFNNFVPAGTLLMLDGYGSRVAVQAPGGVLVIGVTPYKAADQTGEFLAGDSDSPDTCNGDSGSPIYFTDSNGTMWVAGVRSRSTPADLAAGTCGDGSIYTIPNYYWQWISQNSGGAYPPGGSGAGGTPSSSGGTNTGGCKCEAAGTSAPLGPGLCGSLVIALFAARRRRNSHRPGGTE